MMTGPQSARGIRVFNVRLSRVFLASARHLRPVKARVSACARVGGLLKKMKGTGAVRAWRFTSRQPIKRCVRNTGADSVWCQYADAMQSLMQLNLNDFSRRDRKYPPASVQTSCVNGRLPGTKSARRSIVPRLSYSTGSPGCTVFGRWGQIAAAICQASGWCPAERDN